MIRHVILFKFNEGVDDSLQQDAIARLKDLGEQCPTIGSWSIGTNITDSPSAHDVIEIGEFSSAEDLDEYKAHPAHLAFSEFIRPLTRLALVDYEVEDATEEPEPVIRPDVLGLAQIIQIPPVTLMLNGAKYNYNSRKNRAYGQLRDSVELLTGDDISISQLGRTLVRLVQGKVPREVFTHNPRVAVTYNATIRNADDLRLLQAKVGKGTANHLLFIFHKLVTAPAVTPLKF